jgi:GDP-L-fucose synthase
VKRLLFLGSSCIYPKAAPQPMREACLLTGPLEPTNRPYALAKIAGIEMCWSYNRQYGTRFLAAMPTNLYGPGDNYHPTHSHVIPALLRKFHEARQRGDEAVTVWGSGTPRREFLYSDDMADACVFLMNLPDERYTALLGSDESASGRFEPPLINIGVGEDLTIAELAATIAQCGGLQRPHRLRRQPARRHTAQADGREPPAQRRLAGPHAAGARAARSLRRVRRDAGRLSRRLACGPARQG